MKLFKLLTKYLFLGTISIVGLFALDTILFEKKSPSVELEEIQSYEFLDINRMLRVSKYAIGDNEESGGWYESDNYPRKDEKFIHFQGIKLILTEKEFTSIDSIYIANKLYLLNNSESKLCLGAQDSRLNITMQAKNMIGIWQNIEYMPNSWCGNSYHTVCLNKNEYWEFSSPIFRGRHKTKLRYKLKITKEDEIISNEIDGYVNTGQFINKEKYIPRGVMDPYNE